MLDPTHHPYTNAAIAQLSRIRPALIVGLGGTGQQTLTQLKHILETRYGPHWRNKIQLISLDTADESLTIAGEQGEISLEPGVELQYIGNVPVPRIRRNLDNQTTIRERLGPIISSLPATVLRSGARQLRPFGLMALLWHYQAVIDTLSRAIWKLAGRNRMDDETNLQQGINVSICGSLVGGTGSGTFLDTAIIIRSLIEELGTQAEFCHLTGIGVLPQAFRGIEGPNMLANTAAALEELNYLMVQGDFQGAYQDGRQVNSREAPFNLFYVIDGVDERGRTWTDLSQVCRMIAEGIALQMGSQVGQKGENNFDNLLEKLIGQTPDGDGTFLGSFGLSYLEFEAPAVARICTLKFIKEVVRHGWQQPAAKTRVETTVPERMSATKTEHLLPKLLHDPETNGEMKINLTVPGWLFRQRTAEIPAAAARYVREYGQARLQEQFLPQIRQNGTRFLQEQQQAWHSWLQQTLLDPAWGIPTLLTILHQAETILNARSATTRKSLSEEDGRFQHLTETVAHLQKTAVRTADSFFLGRHNRVQSAVTRYLQVAHTHYETEFQQQLLKTRLHIWNELLATLRSYRSQIETLAERLDAMVTQLTLTLPAEIEALARGRTARISLADADYIDTLYQHHQPTWADIPLQIGDSLPYCHFTADQLQQQLLAALQPNFHAIASMTIEQVIAERTREASPDARRRQLLAEASASWNIDRTRLPNGGADMVRITVIGVPDSDNTLFAGEQNLVSTHDPHRLVALTVVAGAPQSALQQHSMYRQALDRSHSRRSLYILPAFLATADQGKLAFALGSIYGLIFSQGTFFYYQPADSLINPIKLANGFSNAIQALHDQEGLIPEIMRRIEEQTAHIGLQESIAVLTNYIRDVPEGNSATDELLREMKRQVRTYTEDLRHINEFSAGLNGRISPKIPTRKGELS